MDDLTRSRDYSCCNICSEDGNDVQRGCLCLALPPFAPHPLQDNNGDYVILSVCRLYSKREDFEKGKWTVNFAVGTKKPVVFDLVISNVSYVFTCCDLDDKSGQRCHCCCSFSVLVLSKEFSHKIKVQIELSSGNRSFSPLPIVDIANVDTFSITYSQKQLPKAKKLLRLCKSMSEEYFYSEGQQTTLLLGDKVKAYTEAISYEVKDASYSASGSAILDHSLRQVCGIHHVRLHGSSVSLGGGDTITATGTSVLQMASQLIIQQYSDGSTLSKKYLPAVLATIVNNIDKQLPHHMELAKKGYMIIDRIISMATFNGVELHELILYLHQSHILKLQWFTNHKAYRVTSELRLLLTILSKYKDAPPAESPVGDWELGDLVPKETYIDTMAQYGESLGNILEKTMASVQEHQEAILMCLQCWNLLVSYCDRLKQRMITRGFQEQIKQLVNGNKFEVFPKLQCCLLQSYVMITDYLSTTLQKDHEELEMQRLTVSLLRVELESKDDGFGDKSLLVVKPGPLSDDFEVIEAPTPPPTRNESTDSLTSSMAQSGSLTSSMNHSGSHNVPPTLLPPIHERFPTAIDFSQQFVDEPISRELLKDVAHAIHNRLITIDAVRVELGVPPGEMRNQNGLESWVQVHHLLEVWRDQDANNNTQKLAAALYNFNLARIVEESSHFKRSQ